MARYTYRMPDTLSSRARFALNDRLTRPDAARAPVRDAGRSLPERARPGNAQCPSGMAATARRGCLRGPSPSRTLPRYLTPSTLSSTWQPSAQRASSYAGRAPGKFTMKEAGLGAKAGGVGRERAPDGGAHAARLSGGPSGMPRRPRLGDRCRGAPGTTPPRPWDPGSKKMPPMPVTRRDCSDEELAEAAGSGRAASHPVTESTIRASSTAVHPARRRIVRHALPISCDGPDAQKRCLRAGRQVHTLMSPFALDDQPTGPTCPRGRSA